MGSESTNVKSAVANIPVWDYSTTPWLPSAQGITGRDLSVGRRNQLVCSLTANPEPARWRGVTVSVLVLSVVAWKELSSLVNGRDVPVWIHVAAVIVTCVALAVFNSFLKARFDYRLATIRRNCTRQNLQSEQQLSPIFTSELLLRSSYHEDLVPRLSLNQLNQALTWQANDALKVYHIRATSNRMKPYYRILFAQALAIRDLALVSLESSKQRKNLLISGELNSLYLSHPGLLEVVDVVFSAILHSKHVRKFHNFQSTLRPQIDTLQRMRQIDFILDTGKRQKVYIDFLKKHIPDYDKIAKEERWFANMPAHALEGMMQFCQYLANPSERIADRDFYAVMSLAHRWEVAELFVRGLKQLVQENKFSNLEFLPKCNFYKLESVLPTDIFDGILSDMMKAPRNYTKMVQKFREFVKFCCHVGLDAYAVKMIGPMLIDLKNETELPCAAKKAAIGIMRIAIVKMGRKEYEPHLFEAQSDYYTHFEGYNPGMTFDEYWRLLGDYSSVHKVKVGDESYNDLLDFISTEEGEAVVAKKFPGNQLPWALRDALEEHLMIEIENFEENR